MTLLLVQPGAADLYRVEGEFRALTSDPALPLQGLVEIDPANTRGVPGLVPRFAIDVDGRQLRRLEPVRLDFERGGLSLTRDGVLEHDGDRVDHFQLTTQSKRLPGPEVVFQHLTLDGLSGHVENVAADTELPQAFEVQGALIQSRYGLPDCDSPIRLLEPRFELPGGSMLSGGDIALRAGATIEAVSPISGGEIIVLDAGDGIGGRATPRDTPPLGGRIEVAPAGAPPSPGGLDMLARATPSLSSLTLEDLGVEASAGVTLQVEPEGVVRVESTGDLHINPGLIEIEGLRRIEFHARANLRVGSAGIEVREDVDLVLNAGNQLDIDGGLSSPRRGDGSFEPIGVEVCPSAVPLPDGEEEVGEFALRATRVTPAKIKVRNGHKLKLRRRAWIRVNVMGSEALDVRELATQSLRLGLFAAEPHSRGGGRSLKYRDLDRDGHLDLRLRFRLEDSGIQRGDSGVCLEARTHGGTPVLGCSAIGTAPRDGAQHRRELIDAANAASRGRSNP